MQQGLKRALAIAGAALAAFVVAFLVAGSGGERSEPQREVKAAQPAALKVGSEAPRITRVAALAKPPKLAATPTPKSDGDNGSDDPQPPEPTVVQTPVPTVVQTPVPTVVRPPQPDPTVAPPQP